MKWGTIQGELESLVGDDSLSQAVFLFHTPPYDTALDRAGLDGRTYEHVPLDLHVGSITAEKNCFGALRCNSREQLFVPPGPPVDQLRKGSLASRASSLMLNSSLSLQ